MSDEPVETGAEAPERVASFANRELQAIFGVTLVAVLGVASIAPALPSVARELEASAGQVALLITVFTLPGVLLTPLLGVLADRWGRRRILVPSLVLFGLAGASCSLVRELDLLLILRFVQGVGAAALGALNVTLVGDLFSGRQRTAAMGYNSSVLSVGTATYPAVGGALAAVAWYLPFALPLLAFPVAILVMLRLPGSEPRVDQTLAAYLKGVGREVANRQVLTLFAASTMVFVILYGAYLTYLPILMAIRFSAGPVTIGLFMTLTSVVSGLTSTQLGRLVRWRPEWVLVRIGFLVLGVGLAVVPLVTGLIGMAVPAVIIGLGFATSIPLVLSILAGLAPAEHRAAFMSLNGMVLRLGQTLGPLVMTAVYASAGLGAVFVAGAVFSLGVAVVLAMAVRNG